MQISLLSKKKKERTLIGEREAVSKVAAKGHYKKCGEFEDDPL